MTEPSPSPPVGGAPGSPGSPGDAAALRQSAPGTAGRHTGDDDLDARIESLLDELGVTANRDQLRELLISVVRLAQGHPDRLDLKIVNAALREMREGFEVFAPYREVRKITMFGSARTLPTDPLYAQARDLASPPCRPGLVDGHGGRARGSWLPASKAPDRSTLSGSTSASPSSKSRTSSSRPTRSWSR